MKKAATVVELDTELSAYDAISVIWDIPRHRVKNLIIAGCYGMGGSHKTYEQWVEQLAAWDEAEDKGMYVKPAEKIAVGTQTGRFSSRLANILKFRGK